MKRVRSVRLMGVDSQSRGAAVRPPNLAVVLDDANGGHVGRRAFEKAQKLGSGESRRAGRWRIARAREAILFARGGQPTTSVDKRSGRPDSRTRHSKHEGSGTRRQARTSMPSVAARLSKKKSSMIARSSGRDDAWFTSTRNAEPPSSPFVYHEHSARSLLITQRS